MRQPFRTSGEKIVKTYSVFHPNKLPPFTKCEENNTDGSFLGINSCIKVLNNLNFDPEISPVEIVIEMIYSTVKEEVTRIGRSFITKKYCPRTKELLRKFPTESISNHTIHNITSSDQQNPLNWVIPVICSSIGMLVTILLIGYCLRKKKKKEVGSSVNFQSSTLSRNQHFYTRISTLGNIHVLRNRVLGVFRPPHPPLSSNVSIWHYPP
jgi:hypothetical protein